MSADRHVPIRYSIATRMFKLVFVCYLLIAVSVTVAHMLMEYHYQKESIKEDLKGNIRKAFQAPMALSIWSLDSEALDSNVKGILNIPTVVGMEIHDNKERYLAVGGVTPYDGSWIEIKKHIDMDGLDMHSITTLTSNSKPVYELEMFKYDFPLIYNNYGEEVNLGHVTLYSSTSVILRRVKLQFLLLIVNALLKTLALWLLFLFFAHYLLRKPLAALSEATSNVQLENLGDNRISVIKKGKNELNMLQESFNSMINKLHHSMEEREKAEKEVKRQAENMRITLNSIGDAVIATDSKCIVQRMNPVAEKLTGWSDGEGIGKPLSEVLIIKNAITGEACFSRIDRVLEKGDTIELREDAVLTSRDGSEFQVADSCAPIRNVEKDIVGAVLVFRDISEQHRLANQLRQGEKLQAVGQLAGGIAHDFNNMLGGIIGCAELIEMHVKEEAEVNNLLKMIKDAVKRSSELIDKLMAFARKGQKISTPLNIHDVIHDTVAILKNTIDKRITIEVELESESSSVVGDPSLLQNVFLNLGINASHAMPEGGILSFHSTMMKLDRVYCDKSVFNIVPGDYIDVTVRDTGCGISPENLDKIFEPFFTTRDQGGGTGLGLSAVYGTVQQHGGAITVYSEIAEGTCFHILLPITSKEAEIRFDDEIIHKGSGCILVVDDEPILLATAKAYLKKFGYEAMLAKDGVEAVECYRKHGDNIDLVLCDMIMPNMNGYDCFFKIKEIDPDVKFIISSGFTKDEEVSEIKQKGLSGFIQKPYNGSELSRILADALKGKKVKSREKKRNKK